jgi:hypothetical protein
MRCAIGAAGSGLQWSLINSADVPAETSENGAGVGGESIADGHADAGGDTGGDAAGDETGADDGSAITPEEFEALRP